VAAGIIDPTKVVRVALQDAALIAGLLITTEAMVIGRSPRVLQLACRPAVWVAWAAWITKPPAAPTP
jgi:hypothetical protein